VTGEPDICKHMEEVIFGAPMAEATLARRREALRAAAKARGSESAHSQLVNYQRDYEDFHKTG